MPKSSPELVIIDINIDKNSYTPIYQQLYENIRNAIVSGKIRAGERLPATRQLASELGISRNIVSLAFEQLGMEGFVQGKTGSGTFVAKILPDDYIKSRAKSINQKPAKTVSSSPAKYHQHALKRNSETEQVLPFQNAVPALDLFPFALWSKIAAKTYRHLERMHLGYGDAAGYAPLRECIATYLRTARGVRCEPDQVVITSGTQQSLSLCAHLLLNRGDNVIVEDPGYPGARAAFQNYGATLLPAPVDPDGVNVEFIRKNYTNARLIYITPSQQYPLGGTLSTSKRMDLLNYAVHEDSWIVEDDYDSELKYKGRPLAALQGLDEHGKVIYLGTFSKVLFPALRVGYMVLPTADMAEYFSSFKAGVDRQMAVTDQHVLTSFIEEGHFFRHLRKMRIAYHERQMMMIHAVEKDMNGGIRVQEQDAGMHMIGWLHEEDNDKEISKLLLQHGIIAHPLSEYSLQFRQGPALLLGYTAFNKFKIRAQVQRMATILSGHRKKRK